MTLNTSCPIKNPSPRGHYSLTALNNHSSISMLSSDLTGGIFFFLHKLSQIQWVCVCSITTSVFTIFMLVGIAVNDARMLSFRIFETFDAD